MGETEAELSPILMRGEAGEISAAVGLMEMLIASEDEAVVARFLDESGPRSPFAREMGALLRRNGPGCARVAAMLRSGVDSPPKDASVADGIAFCARLFDWSVQQSEEASVALYSLGDPSLLQAATDEIVRALDAWGALGSERHVLDVGCGIGRMEEALAPFVRSIHGIDVSSQMIAAARRRCATLTNASFELTRGEDLARFERESFDLVLAVDSFPYLVQSGDALAEAHIREAARVLREDGDLVILNYSYRGDSPRDVSDVSRMAAAHGLHVIDRGSRPFALWNGESYRMRKTRRLTSASSPGA